MKIFKLPRFARRFIRRHTEQIPVLQAIGAQKKLSILYTIITWNIFGYIIYKLFRDKELIKQEPNQKRWWEGKVYGMDTANIHRYRVDGFSLVEVKDPKEDTTKVEENLE